MSKIRYYLAVAAISLVAGSIIVAAVTIALTSPKRAKITIGVTILDEYEDATEAAMDVWNDFVGCEFLINNAKVGTVAPSYNILVMSDNGEPCGDMMRPKDEWNHDATAYKCKNGGFQILISHPGMIDTQAAIIAHELGHTFKEWGVKHASIGVMSNPKYPGSTSQNYLRIRDRDSKALKEEFCE